jgi:MraZ protein
VGNRVEIWSEQLWREYAQNAGASYEEISEKLVELGI